MRSLGRLSIRGYLIGAGFVLIAVLATYAQIHGQRQLATEQARKLAATQVSAHNVSLHEANSAAKSETPPQTLSDNTSSRDKTLPEQSSPVAQARHQANTLVFTPANISISLSRMFPTVTVSGSDNVRLHAPRVISSTAGLLLEASNSGDIRSSWQMKTTGHPLPGTYQVQLSATADTANGPQEYTGTLTVVVIL